MLVIDKRATAAAYIIINKIIFTTRSSTAFRDQHNVTGKSVMWQKKSMLVSFSQHVVWYRETGVEWHYDISPRYIVYRRCLLINLASEG